jgi:predicted small lipoprotein YifL
MKKFMIIALCMVLIFSLIGCGGKNKVEPGGDKADVNQPSEQPNDPNNNEFGDEKVKLWADVSKYIEGVYTYNTDDKTFIMAALGEKPTAGYKVEIKKSGETADEIRFDVSVEEPVGPAAEMITYPYAWIEIERTDKELKIDTKSKIENRSQYPPANEHFIITNLKPMDVVEREFEIKGYARVFEASFGITLEDGHNILVETCGQASQGAPEWGEFTVKIKYENPSNPVGTLILFEESAKDGSPVHQIMLPVTFMEFVK